MITEKDLQEAIAECQGVRNPTSSTCIKLAAFYILQDHLFERNESPVYSYSAGTDNIIEYNGKTEFSELVNGRPQAEVMPIIEELMETVQALNPRLYASVIRKLT